MENFLNWLVGVAQNVGLKLLAAILVWIVGSLLIKGILKIFPNGKKFDKMDPTVKSFLNSFVNIGLWVILIVCIVAILGVPMASVIAAIASCGVAIGLAMQGSLSNLAGGIMLLLFRPFSVDEFIETSGVSGTVREIGIFYTLLITVDNKHVTIPNGAMMNNTVINYTFSASIAAEANKAYSFFSFRNSKFDMLSTPVCSNLLPAGSCERSMSCNILICRSVQRRLQTALAAPMVAPIQAMHVVASC